MIINNIAASKSDERGFSRHLSNLSLLRYEPRGKKFGGSFLKPGYLRSTNTYVICTRIEDLFKMRKRRQVVRAVSAITATAFLDIAEYILRREYYIPLPSLVIDVRRADSRASQTCNKLEECQAQYPPSSSLYARR